MILRFLILSLCLTANAATWYASPTGLDEGAGTLASPLSLKAAIGDGFASPCAAGDTLYLRGGTYAAASVFTSQLAGAGGNPIAVRPYGAEQPVIESSSRTVRCLDIYGSYSHWYGIEVRNTATDRTQLRATGISIWGPGVKVINCFVHDVGTGIGAWDTTEGVELTGNVLQYCGDDTLLSHSIYTHSTGTGILVNDNISFDSFGFGITVYSESAGEMTNATIIGNTMVRSGSLNSSHEWKPNFELGGSVTANMATILYNMGYYSTGTGDNLQLGFLNYDNGTAVVQSNYWVGGELTIRHWTNLTFTANTVANHWIQWYYPSATIGTYDWDNNVYHMNQSEPWAIDDTLKTWTQWQADSGYDGSTAFSTSDPAATRVFVRSNPYQSGRANVTVFNWSGTDNVSVDLSTVLTLNQNYVIKSSADFFGNGITNVYHGGSVSLGMTNWGIATPVGTSAPTDTLPSFGAFVVLGGTVVPTAAILRNLRVSNAVIR